MTMFDKAPHRVCVGKLPGREGIWLYELDGPAYRVLARFKDEKALDRFLLLKGRGTYHQDLEAGFECNLPGNTPPESFETSSLLNQ